MKRSRMVFAACMGLALSLMAGRMSAYAGEEGTELRVSSSNMVSTHGTQLFSAGAAYGYGENRQAEQIIIDQIALREPLKDVIFNVPRDRMRVQEVDLRGKNPKLKIR